MSLYLLPSPAFFRILKATSSAKISSFIDFRFIAGAIGTGRFLISLIQLAYFSVFKDSIEFDTNGLTQQMNKVEDLPFSESLRIFTSFDPL